jgi:formate dehydrogenase subunit gamma
VPGYRPWDIADAILIIHRLEGMPGALLPMLHALQEEFGYIHADADPLLAEALNISLAEVRGVISFYHDFRRTPPGRHLLQVCRAESCQAMGANDLVRYLQARLQTGFGETASDGAYSLEAVYCLGNCALSPALMLDGSLHGRLTIDKAERLLQQAEARV